MRVGLVCPYSLTLPGGVQGQVLALGRGLQRLGVEARVLGPCDGPPPEAWVTPLGNSVPTAANGSMAAIAPDPSATLRTIRALRDEAFDVVHIHEPLVPGPALSALLFCDMPTIGTFHRSGQSPAYRTFRGLAVRFSARLDRRVAVSVEARDTAQRALGGVYELLWNGIDTTSYQRVAPWPTAGPTILFVGRHEERKGLAVLLEAFSGLDGAARLWVAGEGPDTARLTEAHRDDPRIEWLGTIPEAEKLARLAGADVFCAPSLSGESFGVVLLEGMAAGSVVVGSDLPGYRSVARPDVDALLVPPGDAVALRAALGRALRGGPAMAAMVTSGRGRAAHFSIDRLAERYLELSVDLVAGTPSS